MLSNLAVVGEGRNDSHSDHDSGSRGTETVRLEENCTTGRNVDVSDMIHSSTSPSIVVTRRAAAVVGELDGVEHVGLPGPLRPSGASQESHEPEVDWDSTREKSHNWRLGNPRLIV